MSGSIKPGTVIGGHYQVKDFIGKGAMADVYEALDTFQRTRVALKVLRSSVAEDEEARARFDREVEVQERINHRNVVVLQDAGVTPTGQPFLVLELLSGRTLQEVIKDERRVAPPRAVSFVSQALRGLDAIHGAGIVHRDLKPANLAIQPENGSERVLVIDFGFAMLHGASRLTLQGFVVGSLSYMAPERLRNEAVDHRADVYSMAVVLYELLVGARPFTGADDFEIMTALLERQPVPPREAAPDAGISKELETMVLRGLAKYPDKRYPTAGAYADALESLL